MISALVAATLGAIAAVATRRQLAPAAAPARARRNNDQQR